MPPKSQNLHDLAEYRSRKLHLLVADRLAQDPSLLSFAHQRLHDWSRQETLAPEYARAWQSWLEKPLPQLLAFLRQDSEEARTLRQSSPFTFLVTPQERWNLWTQAKEEWEAGQ